MGSGGFYGRVWIDGVRDLWLEPDVVMVGLTGPGYRFKAWHETLADVGSKNLIASCELTNRSLGPGPTLDADDLTITMPKDRRPWWKRWLAPRWHRVEGIVVYADRGTPEESPLIAFIHADSWISDKDPVVTVQWSMDGIAGIRPKE